MFYNYNPLDKENRPTMIWIIFLFTTIYYVALEAPLIFVMNYKIEEHNLWWDAFFSIVFFADIYLRLSNKLKLPSAQHKWEMEETDTAVEYKKVDMASN